MTSRLISTLTRACVSIIGLGFVTVGSQAALDIPDVPLFMNSTGVKPNFIMTLDDSGSMQWAYVPDNRSGNHRTNRFKSSYYNGMYYNPNTQYYPPPKYNGSNCTLDSSNPATCYPNIDITRAPINGFAAAYHDEWINLDTDYRAVRVYTPDDDGQTYAGSPTNDSDRTYYASTITPSESKNSVCTVQFEERSRTERLHISGCSPAVTFTTQDTGQSLTIQCLASDGCSGLDAAYMSNFDGDGNPLPYTMTRRDNDTVSIGEHSSRWPGTRTHSNVRLQWNRPTGTTVSTYPPYYYLLYSQAGVTIPSGCPASTASQLDDDDCYVRIWVGAANDIYKNPNNSAASITQKKQNFANWYSYYRTRNLSLVSGTMTALTGLDGDVRVAWQALNTCNTFSYSSTSCRGWDSPSTGVDNRIRALDATLSNGKTHRQELYDWLARFPANGWTPLRTAAVRAGQYCDTTVTTLNAASPWAENPPTSLGTAHACRRNVHLLMTDGIWNTNAESGTVSVGNANSSMVTLPTGTTLPNGATTWTPGPPYTDSNSNDISDISFYYWSRDLAPTLANNLTPLYKDRSGDALAQWTNAKNDPAAWQHLNTYGISLGLSSVLVSSNRVWSGDTYSGGYLNFLSGTSWPTTGNGNSPGNAYDMWHAAISGRGQFYSAETAQELKNAFKSVIDSVSTIASAGGGAGLGSNSTKIATDTTVYLATFGGDWSGSLQAIPLQSDGSLGSAFWDAGQRIPYADQRKIFTRNSGTTGDFDSCTNALQTSLNTNKDGVSDGLCSQRLAWLRGYQRVTNATWSSSTATLTVPKHGLAIGNSVVVSGVTPTGFNGTYTVTGTGTDTFTYALSADPGTFTNTTIGRVRYQDFRERVSTVLGDIMNSDPAFSHKQDFGYGSTSLTGSASYNSFVTGKSSRKPLVLVGANDGMFHAINAETAGADAGKEIFAYVPSAVYGNLSKLTSPLYDHRFFVDGSPSVGDAYDGSNWKTLVVSGLGSGGKSVFALDITDTTAPTATGTVKWEFSDANLGLTYSQPQIAPISTSQWAAVFGNGYNSSADTAYLYVVNLFTGAQIAKISTNSETSNGLATPYLHDSNGDKIVDVVYAGDMQGNLWKFVNTAGTWTLGNGNAPLFTAQRGVNRQPITSQPKALPHPNGGVMVYFGTGSYLTNNDLTNSQTQSFYGIWDNGVSGTVARTSLLPQTLTTTGGLRSLTSTATDWATQRGWYIDFAGTSGRPSERILSAPIAKDFSTLEDRVIFVTTTPETDPCLRGGVSWLMEVSTLSGGQLTSPVLDTNNDGTINASDAVVAGKQLPDTLGISKTPLWVEGGSNNPGIAFKFFTGSKGTTHSEKQPSDPEPPSGGATRTKVYWRQIM